MLAARSSCTCAAAARDVPARRAGGSRAPRGVAPGWGVCDLRLAERALLGGRSRSASRACSRCGSCPDWQGSGVSAAYLPTWPASAPSRAACRGRAIPRSSSARRRRDRPAPVWIGALCGRLAHSRSHGGRARLRRGGMGLAHRRRHRSWLSGGGPLPRSARGRVVCPSGSASSPCLRLASRARGRAVLAAALVAVSAPFVVSRAVGLAHQCGLMRRLGTRSSRRCGAPSTEPNGELRSPAVHPVVSRAAWRTAWPGNSTSALMMSGSGLTGGGHRLHRRRRRRRHRATAAPQRHRDATHGRGRGVSFWSGGARTADSMSRSSRAAVSCEQRGDGSLDGSVAVSCRSSGVGLGCCTGHRGGGCARGGGRCARTWFGRPARLACSATPLPTLLLLTKPAVGERPGQRVARFAAQQSDRARRMIMRPAGLARPPTVAWQSPTGSEHHAASVPTAALHGTR